MDYAVKMGMAKIFVKALPDSQYKDINDLSLIPDSNVPDYVKKLFKAGIMIGDEDNSTFRLNDNITRAETACIINRVLLPKQRQVVEKPVDLYPGNYPGTLPGAKPGFEGSGNTPVVEDKEETLTGIDDIDNYVIPESTYEMLNLVNNLRLENGIEPLKLNKALCYGAELRVEEIKTKFSHTRPDGTPCTSILYYKYGMDLWAWGENITGYTTSYTKSNVERAFELWVNSAGHRANILNKDYTEIGFAIQGTYSGHAVQLFD